jgi:hypothetical protein
MKYLSSMDRYDKIICVSKDIVNDINSYNPKLSDKTTCIYNPIDFHKIENQSKVPFGEDEQSLLNDKYILMVSRID